MNIEELFYKKVAQAPTSTDLSANLTTLMSYVQQVINSMPTDLLGVVTEQGNSLQNIQTALQEIAQQINEQIAVAQDIQTAAQISRSQGIQEPGTGY